MAAEHKAGLDRKLSAETIWLLNRQTIALRFQIDPVLNVENWPSYERDVALLMLSIEAEAEKKRPKKRKS